MLTQTTILWAIHHDRIRIGCQFKLQTSNPEGPADVDVEASFQFEIHVMFAELLSVEIRCITELYVKTEEATLITFLNDIDMLLIWKKPWGPLLHLAQTLAGAWLWTTS